MKRGYFTTGLVFAALMLMTGAVLAQPLFIPPGDDCWSTGCGQTRFSFCDTPIPAGFFDPGSEPFTGIVLLQGPNGVGDPDTIVRRLAPMNFGGFPATANVPIELVQLSLVSCTPITVTTGTSGVLWNVEVHLSPDPTPPGSMFVIRTHPNGGFFNSEFLVHPVFTFSRVSNPLDIRVLDPGIPQPFSTLGQAPWVSVITPGVASPCAPGFAPGVEQDPLTLTQCCRKVGHAGPGHIHETAPPDCSGCPGACLDPATLTCTLASAATCALAGGVHLGDGVACHDSDGDLLPDLVETNDCCTGFVSLTATGTNPNDPDSDGDGVLDGAEILAGTDPCAAGPPPFVVPPGPDCWSTECGNTRFSFCGTPIPAGFFDPGSDPFTGVVHFGGPSGSSGTDTVVQRLAPMDLSIPGVQVDIPIELISLSLVSCNPIQVVTGGISEPWSVAVGLSPIPAQPGTMTVTKTHPNGGTFDSVLFVRPVFTFTQVSNPGNVRVLDPGLDFEFATTGTAPWVHTVAPGIATGCSPNFVPGVEEDPVTLLQCCKKVGHAGPGHIHETAPPDCSGCPGACLDPATLSCTLTDGPGCALVGGAFLGAATSCEDSDGDGLPDGVETNDCCTGFVSLTDTGTNPLDPDSDGDGVLDGAEVLAGSDPCAAGPPPFVVLPGPDCWSTECGNTRFSFCGTPIPAGFFDPGSDPFTGVVHFGGPSGSSGTDTVVQRLQPMDLTLIGAQATVPIEIVALSLVSCSPIQVVTGGLSEPWSVAVGLSPIPAQPGTMTVTKTHPNGGTFDSVLFVRPVFTFTQVSNPGNVRVLDPGVGLPFVTTGTAPWVHSVAPGIATGCTPNFVPGVEEDPVTLLQCCKKVGHAGPGHIHETAPPDCSGCPGACLDPATLSCTLTDGPGCALVGGAFLGAATSCEDSDGDGLPDGVETNDCCTGFVSLTDTGTNPLDPDSDGDGVPDGAEVLAGTDPCNPAPPVVIVPPGDDCWGTECGRTRYSFCDTPIPANFFDPGSDRFGRWVQLGGPFGASGNDTIVRRLEQMEFPALLPSTATVPIEIVALSLVSCAPIVVTGSGPDSQWDVSVSLSPIPSPLGTMTVTKTHANGGTFDSVLFVHPIFTFTRVGAPGDVRVLDPGTAVPFQTTAPAPWVHAVDLAIATPCTLANFVPGVEEDPATLAQCCKKVGHAGPGHIHETAPPDCSGCPGACLDPSNLDCTFVTESDCAFSGGVFLGYGSSCVDSDGDGLPDLSETLDCCTGFIPLADTGSDPLDFDTDNDTVGDGAEVLAGTDPCEQAPPAVTGLTCAPVAGPPSVALAWSSPIVYGSILVFVDSLLVDTIPGSATGHVVAVSSGLHTICVSGVVAGFASIPACCDVAVGVPPVTGLVCTPVPGTSLVDVAWSNAAAFDAIEITVDGFLVSTLGGAATATTVSLSQGTHSICVTGVVGGGSSVPVCCSVTLSLFRRGDCNADGNRDIGDPIYLLGNLFSGGPTPSCRDSCDSNDDGGNDIGDAVHLLGAIFSGGPQPPAPNPGCGTDPTADPLDCIAFPPCP